MPLKGVLGLYRHIYLYIYIYILPCLQGVGRLWLDGCGDLIQLWILMNPLLHDGRESRKLWMWPKSCKNVCDAAAEDNWNQKSLRASASCLWGEEETFVTLEDKWRPVPWDLLLSWCFPTPKLRDWSQSEMGGRSAMAQRQPWPASSHISHPCPDRSRTGKTFLSHIKRPKDLFFSPLDCSLK